MALNIIKFLFIKQMIENLSYMHSSVVVLSTTVHTYYTHCISNNMFNHILYY